MDCTNGVALLMMSGAFVSIMYNHIKNPPPPIKIKGRNGFKVLDQKSPSSEPIDDPTDDPPLLPPKPKRLSNDPIKGIPPEFPSNAIYIIGL